jgi:hypothetical protein
MKLVHALMTIATLGITLLTSPARAEGFDPNVIAVKVHSRLCEAGEIDWRGSGFLMRHGDDVFVVTSEHVMLWGGESVCQTVSNPALGRLEADLVAADWGEGLALLRLRERPASPLRLPELGDIGTNVSVGDQVVSVGYPYALDRAITHTGGRVLVPESPRHFLPTTRSAIELENAHGEFGMSGGPLMDAASQSIIGILSHQFLKIKEGGQTVVCEYQSGEAAHQVLVIPGRMIRAWLSRYFDDPTEFRAAFVRDTRAQIEPRNIVYADGLEFETVVAESRRPVQPIGRKNGDPVGIGGDAQVYGKPVRIDIRLDRTEGEHLMGTRWYLSAKADWIKRVKDRLYLNASVSVSSLLYRDPDTQTLSRVSFSSPEEFFRKLSSPNVNPITTVTGGVQGGDLDMAFVAIRGAAVEAQTVANKLLPTAQKRVTRILLNRIRTVTAALQDKSNWMLIELSDLDEVTDPKNRHREAWSELFSSSSIDDPVRMLSLLRQMKNEMAKIKI